MRVINGIHINEEQATQEINDLINTDAFLCALTSASTLRERRQSRTARGTKSHKVTRIEKRSIPEVELSIYDPETGTWKLDVQAGINEEQRQQDVRDLTDNDSFFCLLSKANTLKENRRVARAS